MKTVIEMAQEAGWDMDDTVDGFSVRLERFFNLAYAAGAAAEREACAQVGMLKAVNGIEVSAAIRARGNT